MAPIRSGLLAICAAAALSAGPARAAQLVANGDFEANAADGSSLPGWTVSGVGVADDQVFPNGGLHDAIFTTVYEDADPGLLQQDIATTPGGAYRLSFAVLNEGLGIFDNFSVSFGGFSQVINGLDVSVLLGGYHILTYDILGSNITGAVTTLSFQGLHDSTFGSPFNLDDVSLTAVATGGVPEPAAWVLMIAGFGGAGAALRRKSGARIAA